MVFSNRQGIRKCVDCKKELTNEDEAHMEITGELPDSQPRCKTCSDDKERLQITKGMNTNGHGDGKDDDAYFGFRVKDNIWGDT